jgi:hypothetical protein
VTVNRRLLGDHPAAASGWFFEGGTRPWRPRIERKFTSAPRISVMMQSFSGEPPSGSAD